MSRMKAGMPGTVVTTAPEVYVEGGELRHGLNITVTDPEIIEQWRTGYRCMRPGCWMPQSRPFPEVCEETYKDGGGCGFRIRDEQPAYFEREFGGEVELWPDHDGRDPERESFQARTGLWLPEQ